MSVTQGGQVSDGDLAGADFKFNDDLLLDESDLGAAKTLYPNVFFALDNRDVRNEFRKFDNLANTSKRKSRRLGISSVAMISTSLLIATAEPLYSHGKDLARIFILLSGVLSLCGILFATFGVLFSSSKRRWLTNRLRTEQIRLFHYRMLIELSDLIIKGEREEFLKQRSDRFVEFHQDIIKRPSAALEAVAEAEWTGEGLVPRVPALQEIGVGAGGKELIHIYRRLRIQRQLDYAQYKLQADGRLFSGFPQQQARLLENVALICIVSTITVHGLLLVGVALDIAALASPWVHILGIWFAIVALGLKTLQQGLQPQREVERYRQYRGMLRALATRFDAAQGVAEKMAIAAELERASADEMAIFLRAGHEAHFVM